MTRDFKPTSRESFFDSISEIHYVDVGLNSPGAYLTDKTVIESIAERVIQKDKPMRFVLPGTPRQWSGPRRAWIREEKDKFRWSLESESKRSGGRLRVLKCCSSTWHLHLVGMMSHTSEEFLHDDSIPELQGLTFTPETSSLLQGASSKVDENAAIVEPKGQAVDENPVVDNVGVAETSTNTVQHTSIKSPEVETKEGQIVEDSSIEKVASSGAVDVDANTGDKMAPVAVPTQGQNIDYSRRNR
ncbi:hypothetical protein Cgig2_013049 [Carnegiea gigantea]|uniref:Uncharacterized protein n=1 Tax=Carnegiea gigantea TaxID=171969 RepID=A0A9Q1KRB4_9CARY|nr:hypothetical protein Cgig2_013049 [Carnegiea gigantea]